MLRTILHSDLNNFYASVECVRNPSLDGLPVVVCGDREERHGIVLAKNQLAKVCGIKTGDVLWEAEAKCPNLVEVKADFKTYLEYSSIVRSIYADYTDRIEPFGIDEAWLDVTGSKTLRGTGLEIAEDIRTRVKMEVGLTVSIGVSYNKIFAKLGSDIKKPDAITVITPDNYREIVWPLPVQDLLYVGRATQKKLNRWGIFTIGELANRDVLFLQNMMGKWGQYLHVFANGREESPVMKIDQTTPVKSIGNSLTHATNMRTDSEVASLVSLLCDTVAARLRESGLGKASTLHFHARDNLLLSYSGQTRLSPPSFTGAKFIETAMSLFSVIVPSGTAIRSVGISVSGFSDDSQPILFGVDEQQVKQEKAELTMDKIRKKYGNIGILRGTVASDPRLRDLDIQSDHVIHPENFFK